MVRMLVFTGGPDRSDRDLLLLAGRGIYFEIFANILNFSFGCFASNSKVVKSFSIFIFSCILGILI